VDAEDVGQISHTLEMLYTQWATGTLHYQPDQTVIEQYNRRTLTARLAETFDATVKAK
jgi:hypothetical protein